MTLISNIIFKNLVFFLVGVVQDLFITYYYQTISKGQAWKAGFLSTAITIISLLILYEILSGIENEVISIILAYAVGNGVGTIIVIKKNQIKKFLLAKFK